MKIKILHTAMDDLAVGRLLYFVSLIVDIIRNGLVMCLMMLNNVF